MLPLPGAQSGIHSVPAFVHLFTLGQALKPPQLVPSLWQSAARGGAWGEQECSQFFFAKDTA
jgi:hypothetical protein